MTACFNTQPPEGGWKTLLFGVLTFVCFNTQPPEGGWVTSPTFAVSAKVSTHSRPKAAGQSCHQCAYRRQFQHTAARRRLGTKRRQPRHEQLVSTHSRPKAAGESSKTAPRRRTFQHTAARRRLDIFFIFRFTSAMFQHTAARRRLALLARVRWQKPSFNTQPPEGGWGGQNIRLLRSCKFQHTAARRRLEHMKL